GDGARALPVAGAQTIGAGIAAADDDDALAGGHNLLGHGIALAHTVLLWQVLHGEVDALQLASGEVEIARVFGAARQQDGVELAAQVFHRYIAAHLGIGFEPHPFAAHLHQPPVDEVLLHLETWDAVAQQSADAVGLFEHGDGVAGARQLLRGGQSGGAGTYHRDALAARHGGRFRDDVALGESAVDDGFLDLLDGDRRLNDAQHAGGFTGRGTNAPGEFREIIGGVQLPHRFLPAPLVHQIVPIGNDVGERTTGVAKGDAAIHAARRLGAQVVVGERQVDFGPVLDAHDGVATLGHFPRVFHEAGDFSHVGSPYATATCWRVM